MASTRDPNTAEFCIRAHRTNIVHKLKGLQDIIQIVVMGYVRDPEVGW